MGQKFPCVGLEVLVEFLFKFLDVLDGHVVEVAVGSGVQDRDLVLDRERRVLRLFEDLHHASPAFDLFPRTLVEVRGELRKTGKFSVLRHIETELAGDFFHGFYLRRAADAGHGNPDVQGRPDALIEQVCLEIDLPVRDRDDIGRDISGNITSLRFDYRQGSQTPPSILFAKLGRALQEPRVEVKHISRVSLSSRRTAEQKRYLSISYRVPRQIIINNEYVFTSVHEVLANGASCVRSDIG